MKVARFYQMLNTFLTSQLSELMIIRNQLLLTIKVYSYPFKFFKFMNHSSLLILCLVTLGRAQPTEAQKWGYGILTSISVSLIGFIVAGVIILTKSHSKPEISRKVGRILIGFAVGALLGDACVHLIPEAFGAHSEEETSDQHRLLDSDSEDNHSEEAHASHDDEARTYLTSLTLICGFLAFFLLEKVIIFLESQKGSEDVSKVIPSRTDATEVSPIISASTREDQVAKFQEEYYQKIQNLGYLEQIFSFQSWKHKPSVGYLNLASDFIHNIMDGIAIGAVFATAEEDSFKSVTATVVAVVIHEIAQEIGDTSLLLESNFTSAQTLCANSFVNVSALIGSFIGLGAGNASNGNYVFAWVAGNFLYISMADMVPHLLKEKDGKQGILQFIAILAAIAIMFAIGVLEHSEGHSH